MITHLHGQLHFLKVTTSRGALRLEHQRRSNTLTIRIRVHSNGEDAKR